MSEPKFKVSAINQICLVVKDIDKSIEAYWHNLGIGPWRVYIHGPETVKQLTYRGQPGVFHARIASANVGNLALELVQPLDGDNIYREFMDLHGEGVQHLGISVKSCDEAVAQMREAGFEVIQGGQGSGASGDGRYAYMNTTDVLGVVYEMIQSPSARWAEYWYPAEPASS